MVMRCQSPLVYEFAYEGHSPTKHDYDHKYLKSYEYLPIEPSKNEDFGDKKLSR